MNELTKYIKELFTEEALKPLADYRIVAHQPLNEPNLEMFTNIIDEGVNPEKVYLLPTIATYNDTLANKVKDKGMNLVWDGWINNTTINNRKHDKWFNCEYNKEHENADHLFGSLLNGKYQNTLVIDSERFILPYANHNIGVTKYNKKCVFGVSNNREGLGMQTYLPIIDIGLSRFKFAIGESLQEKELTSALTLAAVYSIFQKNYERNVISKLAEKNPSIIVPNALDKFGTRQLDLNIEDNIVKMYGSLFEDYYAKNKGG